MRKDEIQKYIELVYSQTSLQQKIEDLNERKIEAAKKAKLNPDDLETKKIMSLKNEKVRKAIVDYITKNNSSRFIKLIADQQLFWSMQEKLMKPLEDDDDGAKLMSISEKSQDLLERIEKNYKALFEEQELQEEGKKVVRMISHEERLKSVTKSTA